MSEHALTAFLADPATNVAEQPRTVVEICPDWLFANIRGDPTDAKFAVEFERILGTALPLTPNTRVSGKVDAYWLGPDEWLVGTGGYGDALQQPLQELALAAGCSVVELNDGYVRMTIDGEDARDLLAAGCTLDLHAAVFCTGLCAQTALARASILLAPLAAGGIELVVRRTIAEYLAIWLRSSGRETGIHFTVGSQSE